MKEKDVDIAKFQAIRLQRFYLAQLNYLITYVVIGAAWLVGQYNASGALAISHVVLGASLQLAIFCTIKSGWNLRFKDPSLTSPQIVIAMLLLTYLLAFSGEFRGSLIMIYPIILLFGVFQLSRRAFFAHAALALALYSGLILFNTLSNTSTQPLTVHLLEWFVLACFLGWLSFFCTYIRELRERLQRRHSTLQLHQETLKGMMGQLQNLADTDGLTGLINRRFFLREAQRRINLLGPLDKLGIALIDLDHFKKINDTYGHAVTVKVSVALFDFYAAIFSTSLTTRRSGFSDTNVTGCQLRVSPLQRSGCAALAARLSACLLANMALSSPVWRCIGVTKRIALWRCS